MAALVPAAGEKHRNCSNIIGQTNFLRVFTRSPCQGGNPMVRAFIIAAASVAAFALSATAFAQQSAQFGTAEEAKAMLVKVVAAVKADKAKALDMFNKGEGGFKDRDLQPFCWNVSDGKIVATTVPNLLGTDIRNLKDKTGKEFGQENYKAAIEGKFAEIDYMFPRPGADPTLFKKISFVTGVADLGCGVGYFK
jgi:hypothetical protein